VKIKYKKDYNPILEYWEKIQNGSVIVGEKVHKTVEKAVYDIANPGYFHYSNSRANHVIEFIENYCKHSKGKFAGKPVILELWQKCYLAHTFGFIDDDGLRQYRETILIVGKKNGKSTLASCIGLYGLLGDAEGGAEVYSVATKKDQAKIIWSEAKRMIKKSPELRRRIRPLVAELIYDDKDSVFKPLSSDVDTLDGLNVHFSLMDEFHQWKNGKKLYDIVVDGNSMREQPLNVMTSTAGTIREDIFDDKYDEATKVINGYFDDTGYKDDRLVAYIYELDDKNEWTDEKCWYKGNPALGTVKNIDTLRAKVEKAKKDTRNLRNLLCKEFNIRESDESSWLSFATVNNEETYENVKDRYCTAGVDLSSTTDLTCATLLWCDNQEKIFIKQMYWIPGDLLEKKVDDDKVMYDAWVDRGLVRLSEGSKINYKDITAWFLEEVQENELRPLWVGYDPWGSTYWSEEMADNGFELEPVRQGPITMSQPMKELEADLMDKKINYNNNPVTKWNLVNVVVKRDDNDNIRPVKGKNQKRRIDGAVSLINAYVVFKNHYQEYIDYIN